ncbi:YhgE/Pip domain-containing protein [Cohnella kolymensis]|uniref:YhgE/Pip domain-containing protein n=1 Tax=Cohnella kolymensis TaxID=1590652 RepID=UPI000A68DBBF|nr:ABC transporter permease [Cohnella kolymensis]
MAFLKQKFLWIGVIAAFVVLMVFGVAMMGSVLGAKPKDIPVALVVLDKPADLPIGGQLAVGNLIKDKLLAMDQLPVDWKVVDSEAEAREGLDQQKYYGALLLPGDLSSGVLSIQSPSPQPATVKIIANEGMNTAAATAVRTILQQGTKLISLELSKQVLAVVGKQMNQIPVSAAQALLTPFQVQEETVHPVAANNAGGSAPGMLTQIMWIGSLVTSIFMFLAAQQSFTAGVRKLPVLALQSVIGVAIIGAVSGFLVWMASSWYGMELAHAVDTWLFLWLVGAAFVMLQSSLLSWMGFPAMGILVLLMFFSLPLINLAPEFLPQATHDWLYSWIPFKFATSGLREVMYFGGLEAVTWNGSVLWWIAGVFPGVIAGIRRAKREGRQGQGFIVKLMGPGHL